RLAIGESERSPKIAKALDSAGRETNRAALAAFLAKAAANDLLAHHDPAAMADFFCALLWGDVLIRVLLRVANVPSINEMERRATEGGRALLAAFGTCQYRRHVLDASCCNDRQSRMRHNE